MAADSSSAVAVDAATIAPFIKRIRGPYEFFSRQPLPDDAANRLLVILRSDVEEQPRGILGGRAGSAGYDLTGLGRIFIKQYAHGGILRAITSQHFLAIGKCRAQQEFLMLERVRSLGVRAPAPLVYVRSGSLVYRTWLVMEEVPGVRSLVDISSAAHDEALQNENDSGSQSSSTPNSDTDSPDLQRIMHAVGEQLAILIRNRILHIDLHPGNVLLDGNGEVYLVDFDKARTFTGSAWELRDLYLRRWRRAVIKHDLSPLLTELMSLTLRGYNE